MCDVGLDDGLCADDSPETVTQQRAPTVLTYRQLRAPKEDRSVLAEPPLAEVGPLLQANLEQRSSYSLDLFGMSLAELVHEARAELLAAAARWTATYRDLPAIAETGPLILAGHQPQLFHPGVWLKNFVLGDLARRHGATAVNLVIDSDTLKSSAIRVPTGTPADPRVEVLSFDRPCAPLPLEQHHVCDRAMFDGFGAKVAEHVRGLVPHPLVSEFWPRVQSRFSATGRLGAALAQARHQLEGDWGNATLELPQGQVCDCRGFHRFLLYVLHRLPEFAQFYNATLAEYRDAHGIRSPAQPLPDLGAQGEALETPFWLWSDAEPKRRRLYCERTRNGLRLTDTGTFVAELPDPRRDLTGALEVIAGLRAAGVKIRSRALLTTMWGRLLLSDLFIHGIGGAKYDQVTDEIIRRFFGLEPPGFLVLSGTMLMLVEKPSVAWDDLSKLRHQLWELTHHPETYVLSSAEREAQGADAPRSPADAPHSPDALVAAKQELLRHPPAKADAKRWCQAVREVNGQLQPAVAPLRQRLLALQAETQHALRAKSVLLWREYAFCLFPETAIRDFFSQATSQDA